MACSEYPWYAIVSNDSIEQGDIVSDCPIFEAPSDLDIQALDAKESSVVSFDYRPYDVIVMSQTCDLVMGREKLDEVLLCPLYTRLDFDGGVLARLDGWEDARKGRFPAYHVINQCNLNGHQADFRVVSFRQVFSLPLRFFRNLIKQRQDRIRLLPPYREHLSQGFARFFMRIGLPVDIPSFK